MAFRPYCTVTQLLAYNDVRLVLAHILDTGADAALADLSDPNTPAGANVLEILKAAQAEINSRAQAGKRYTPYQLYLLSQDTQVVDADDPTGFRNLDGAKLRQFAARVWWGMVVQRRNYPAPQFAELVPLWPKVEADLERIELGLDVFDTDGLTAADAGLMGTAVWGADVGASVSITRRAAPFFGCTGLPAQNPQGGPGDFGGRDGGCC